jgi:hypothetical protein
MTGVVRVLVRLPAACVPDVPLVELSFSHYGLALATLVLTVVTFLTGVALLVARYGYTIRENRRTVVRVVHVVGGVFMTLYLLATYVCPPT